MWSNHLVTPASPSLLVAGLGPRGCIVVERLAALLPDSGLTALELHLVDDAEPGAGRVWATDQPREMCMNTLACALTLFTDESCSGPGPVLPGPSLYEWCRGLHEVHRGREWAYDHPLRPSLLGDPGFRDEVAAMLPESHPSRALYGAYLVWFLDRALALLPPWVSVTWHPTRVVGIDDAGAGRLTRLGDGSTVAADAVILATGWLDTGPGLLDARLGEEVAAARAEGARLDWITPESPIRQDLSGVRPGEPVIVRGLGMGFFDSMALLTIGRGGRFVPSDEPGGLTYEPSGEEPVLHAGSRRGVPFRAKSAYGGPPPAPALRHLRSVDWATVTRPIGYQLDVWPLVVRDAHDAYYRVLAEQRPDALPEGLSPVLEVIGAAPVTELAERLAPLVPAVGDRLDLSALADPASGAYASPDEFDAFVAGYVADDLAEAGLGVRSALKAGLWSVSASRRFVSGLLAFDGSDADSHDTGLGSLMAFGGMVGSGPPAFRNRQLLALMRAGLVHMIGPSVHVAVEGGRFVAWSPAVAGSRVESAVLLDAWMRAHDPARTRDPLMADLLAQGRAVVYERVLTTGGTRPTSSPAIDPPTGRLVRVDGGLDVVHLVGIPVDDARGDTLISPIPGSDATMLYDSASATASAMGILQQVARAAS